MVVHRVPVDRAGALTALIVDEQHCCPFLSFELVFTGPVLHLRITAPDGAQALARALVGGELTVPVSA